MAAVLCRSRFSALIRRINVLELRKRASLPMWGAEDDAMFQTHYGEVDTFFLAAVLCLLDQPRAMASTSTLKPKCSGPVGTTALAGREDPAHCS